MGTDDEIRIAETAIRRIWATETRAFLAHLKRLDAESRRMRFGGIVSDHYVEEYAKTALKRAIVVYGWFEGDTLRAACELHGSRFSHTGEAAFSVEPAYQHKGIGSALMKRVVLAARNRGMRHMVVSCLSENSPMSRLARRHNAEIEFHSGETVGIVHSRLPNGLSLLREAIADSHAIAHSMMDIQSGFFDKLVAHQKN